MNILITGASGFIGSHLTHHLCSLGHKVTAFCRSPEKIRLLNSSNLTVVKGFIEDREQIKILVKGQDAVIHCALGWGESPVEMLVRDTLPSVVLFEEAINAQVKKIIYTSSSMATGEYRLDMDVDTVCRSIDAYTATKAATENYLMALSHNTNTQCNIVRPTYTFGNPIVAGATTQPDTKIQDMALQAINNQLIELIQHDGVQMIWVGQLVKVYAAVLQQEITRSIVIAGSAQQIKWSDIAHSIIAITQSKSQLSLKNLGWAETGCLWSTQSYKNLIGEDQDLQQQLNLHIEYLCHQAAQQSSHIESGVEA